MASNGSSTEKPATAGALSIGGIVKLLLLMVVLGVAVGMALRFAPSRTVAPPAAGATTRTSTSSSSGRTSAGTSQSNKHDTKPDVGNQTTTRDVPPPPDNTAIQKPVVEPVAGEDQRARELLESARASLQQLDFANARKACDEAAQLRAAAETKKAAQEFGKKAEQFELAVAHIEVSEFARAETTCALQLRGGRRMRGLIADQQPDRLTLICVPEQDPAAMGSAKMTFPLTDIEQRRQVPLAERQAEFLTLLGRLEGAALKPDSPADDYYDLVVLSRRLGLTEKCLGYLEAAAAKTPDHAVGTLFRKVVIDRTIGRATWLAAAGKRPQADALLRELTNRTFPNYPPATEAVAALYREVFSKIKEDFVTSLALQSAPKTRDEPGDAPTGGNVLGANAAFTITRDTGSSIPAADKLCQQANQTYKTTLANLSTYRRGSDDAMFERLCKMLENRRSLRRGPGPRPDQQGDRESPGRSQYGALWSDQRRSRQNEEAVRPGATGGQIMGLCADDTDCLPVLFAVTAAIWCHGRASQNHLSPGPRMPARALQDRDSGGTGNANGRAARGTTLSSLVPRAG